MIDQKNFMSSHNQIFYFSRIFMLKNLNLEVYN